MKQILIVFLVAFFGLGIMACNSSNSKKVDKVEKVDATKGIEFTSAYICPMHCEGSGSHEMGQCPVCGMDYEKNEDSHDKDHDDHDHDGHDDHEGHDH